MEQSVSQGAALTIVSSISRRWGAKRDAITIIGKHPDGVEAPYRRMAELLDVKERYAWRILRELVRDRIVDELQPPAGRRACLYALNPRIGEWRGVPWKTSIELVAFRAFYDAPEDDECSTIRSAAISYRGTRPVVPRSHIAAQRDRKRLVPRSHSAALQEVYAAISCRGTTDPPPKEVLNPRGESDKSSVGFGSGAAAPPASKEVDPRLDGLRKAMIRRQGLRYMKGAPVDTLASLVDEYGADRVATAIAGSPRAANVWEALDELGLALAPDLDVGEPAPPAPIVRPVPEYIAEGLYDPDTADHGRGLSAARSALRVTPACDTDSADLTAGANA